MQQDIENANHATVMESNARLNGASNGNNAPAIPSSHEDLEVTGIAQENIQNEFSREKRRKYLKNLYVLFSLSIFSLSIMCDIVFGCDFMLPLFTLCYIFITFLLYYSYELYKTAMNVRMNPGNFDLTHSDPRIKKLLGLIEAVILTAMAVYYIYARSTQSTWPYAYSTIPYLIYFIIAAKVMTSNTLNRVRVYVIVLFVKC
eukprot:TRINITY_DN5577_c0_g1_i1.p1 TRINITY_DN5577_c0_g1~~TRINITY_DN5577_c0_g1_i1.p1  ORF type:complete len:202 (-),score=17.44 TRINITY_DN5577_c0_g1_i1:79-684(-)